MQTRWFSLQQDEQIVALGSHADISSADSVAPTGSVWLFAESALRDLIASASAALERDDSRDEADGCAKCGSPLDMDGYDGKCGGCADAEVKDFIVDDESASAMAALDVSDEEWDQIPASVQRKLTAMLHDRPVSTTPCRLPSPPTDEDLLRIGALLRAHGLATEEESAPAALQDLCIAKFDYAADSPGYAGPLFVIVAASDPGANISIIERNGHLVFLNVQEYRGAVEAIDSDGTRFTVGRFHVTAANEDEGRRLAIEQVWDDRLDSVDCSPHVVFWERGGV